MAIHPPPVEVEDFLTKDVKVVFKFEMHHSVLPPKGNPSESKALYHEKTLNTFISLYHNQLMFKLITHITFQKIKKGILDKISKLILIKPNIPLNFVHTSPIERS